MKNAMITGSIVALTLSGSAVAGFEGLTVTYAGSIAGRDVYRVYAQFSGNDQLLSMFNHTLSAGNYDGVLHNDGGANSWDPVFTFLPGNSSSASDSFVTIDGQFGSWSTTILEDAGCGTGWPGGDCPGPPAGWFGSSAATAGTRMIMQVGLVPGDTGWTADLTVGWKVAGTTTALFGYGTYSVGIPAPGSLAVALAAGWARPGGGRRRRRRR